MQKPCDCNQPQNLAPFTLDLTRTTRQMAPSCHSSLSFSPSQSIFQSQHHSHSNNSTYDYLNDPHLFYHLQSVQKIQFLVKSGMYEIVQEKILREKHNGRKKKKKMEEIEIDQLVIEKMKQREKQRQMLKQTLCQNKSNQIKYTQKSSFSIPKISQKNQNRNHPIFSNKPAVVCQIPRIIKNQSTISSMPRMQRMTTDSPNNPNLNPNHNLNNKQKIVLLPMKNKTNVNPYLNFMKIKGNKNSKDNKGKENKNKISIL